MPARLADRLAHAATLLRAESAAILALEGPEVRTVCARGIDPATDWRGLLGAAVIDRAAHSGTPITSAIPAGRWDDRSAFALIGRLDSLVNLSLLCVLRHAVPFDSLETSGMEAAAALLSEGTVGSDSERRAPGRPPALPAATRVLIAESQPATRIGLRTMLKDAGAVVVGECGSGAEAVALARTTRPDVAIIDLSLRDGAGTDLIGRMREAARAVSIIVLAADNGPALTRAVLAAGAAGLLHKDATAEAILAAVGSAAVGLAALAMEDMAALAGAPLAPSRSAEAEAGHLPSMVKEPLTQRELQLLRHLADGATNKEIAREMLLAEDTVKKAVQTVIAKLGATDRTHAVVLALRASLIT